MKPFYVFQVSKQPPVQFRITVCTSADDPAPSIDEPEWSNVAVLGSLKELMASVESYLRMEETK